MIHRNPEMTSHFVNGLGNWSAGHDVAYEIFAINSQMREGQI